MAIFRCNTCGHIREVGSDYIGKTVKCPKCDHTTTIHDTIAFLKALIHKHLSQGKELKALQKQLSPKSASDNPAEDLLLEEIDIHNTSALSQSSQLEPIIQWFKKRQITPQTHPEMVDTTGFFDEIALSLGDNIETLGFVSNQIKYIQNKGYANVKLDLSRKSPEEIRTIRKFCKDLHDYSFVAKYFYIKKDNIIRLTLQEAPKIKAFFNGIWMEWFTFMKMLEFFSAQKITPSCARGLNISFPNGSSNELDLFFLLEERTPVCIECKTGEFRHDINKYLSLRKQLNIDKSQFILCVFGLSAEQAQGMTSMYDITFVNEKTLINHIQTLFP